MPTPGEVAGAVAAGASIAHTVIEGGKEVIGAAQSAYHAIVPGTSTNGVQDAMAANRAAARATSPPPGNRKVVTRATPSLREIQANPVRNLSFHPMCPFPPILTTSLQQTHLFHVNNSGSILAGTHGLPSTAAAGIAAFVPIANNPAGPFGYYVSALGHGKSIPFHKFMMDNIYNNYIVYASKIHFSAIEDQNEKANRIAYAHNAYPQDSAFSKINFYLKLHAGIESGASSWGEMYAGPRRFDGNNWVSSVPSSHNGTTNGPGYFAQIDNWTEWENPQVTGAQRKGSFPERSKYFVDKLIKASIPAGLGTKQASLSGHWNLMDHEGVDWLRCIVDDEYAAVESDYGAFNHFTGWAAGQPHGGHTPHTLAPAHSPRWWFWMGSDDVDFKPTVDFQVRCVIEYDIAYFNLKNPIAETIIDQVQNE